MNVNQATINLSPWSFSVVLYFQFLTGTVVDLSLTVGTLVASVTRATVVAHVIITRTAATASLTCKTKCAAIF